MSLHDLIVGCITRACEDVFSTMMGVSLRRGEISIEQGSPDANDGVLSLIGLAGGWTGAGSLACSPALACRICSALLMTETGAVTEEVLDAVAELTNMIVGGMKTDLEEDLGPLGLSIPTVVFGRNFRTRSIRNPEWIVVRFHWDDECLTVRICLTRTERAAPLNLHLGAHPCAVDV